MSADQNFSRPGAIDLSGLTTAQPAQPNGAVGGSYVVEVSEATFEQVAQQSMRYPIVLAFTSSRDAGSAPAIADLTELVNGHQGRLVLAVVDVDAQPRIAQALGVAAVPTVVALIGGQLAPLYQGTRDRAEVKAVLDQVLQVAAANGVTGRAAPQASAPTGAEPAAGEPASDPRFAAADAALEAGDFEAAVTEFDKLLRANPRDTEAQAGRAQAALLARTSQLDDAATQRADAHPDDIEAQFAAADLELISGNPEAAFQRLIDLVARTAGPEREQVRVRLVELFETMDGADPVVKRARRSLSMVLF